jgi:hypothetical protein
MKPSFFLIIVNPAYFPRKVDAVDFIKTTKAIFKEALIKMVGPHQKDLQFVPKGKFELKLWGCGRKTRNQVHKILTNFAN